MISLVPTGNAWADLPQSDKDRVYTLIADLVTAQVTAKADSIQIRTLATDLDQARSSSAAWYKHLQSKYDVLLGDCKTRHIERRKLHVTAGIWSDFLGQGGHGLVAITAPTEISAKIKERMQNLNDACTPFLDSYHQYSQRSTQPDPQWNSDLSAEDVCSILVHEGELSDNFKRCAQEATAIFLDQVERAKH